MTLGTPSGSHMTFHHFRYFGKRWQPKLESASDNALLFENAALEVERRCLTLMLAGT